MQINAVPSACSDKVASPHLLTCATYGKLRKARQYCQVCTCFHCAHLRVDMSPAARRQVALACNILDGSCFREDPSKTISVQVRRRRRGRETDAFQMHAEQFV